LIGIIRMMTMAIPPIALTGAVFGAFLSGVFYRMSRGKIICAVLGEIIGTGIIGAIASYPVMTLLWGKEGLSWLFYVPSFICGTLIGGSIARPDLTLPLFLVSLCLLAVAAVSCIADVKRKLKLFENFQLGISSELQW